MVWGKKVGEMEMWSVVFGIGMMWMMVMVVGIVLGVVLVGEGWRRGCFGDGDGWGGGSSGSFHVVSFLGKIGSLDGLR